MKLELKGLSSIDLPDGRRLPDEPADCRVRMAAEIGLQGGAGADIFYFAAATANNASETRGVVVIERFSWERVEETVREMISDVPGETWEDAAQYLNARLCWESE